MGCVAGRNAGIPEVDEASLRALNVPGIDASSRSVRRDLAVLGYPSFMMLHRFLKRV